MIRLLVIKDIDLRAWTFYFKNILVSGVRLILRGIFFFCFFFLNLAEGMIREKSEEFREDV